MSPLLTNSRRPDVTFCPDGRIDITARIAKMLQLQNGDVINIAYHCGEYYLYVALRASQCVGLHEATVSPTNHGKRHNNNFRAYSKFLCRSISKAAYGCSDRKTRLPAGSPFEMAGYGTVIPLITKNPL